MKTPTLVLALLVMAGCAYRIQDVPTMSDHELGSMMQLAEIYERYDAVAAARHELYRRYKSGMPDDESRVRCYNGQVTVGMSEIQVMVAWGPPLEDRRVQTPAGEETYWSWGSGRTTKTATFRNARLIWYHDEQ